jgi:hypothetical protein
LLDSGIVTPTAISKVLSANDTGETGGHQAGMLIPKNGNVLAFFPHMGRETKNPRSKLRFVDNAGVEWDFMFIYYNNRFFDGTRNEFRLTGMTAFIRQNELKAGDTIILSQDIDERKSIKHERALVQDFPNILRLGSSWKVVKL